MHLALSKKIGFSFLLLSIVGLIFFADANLPIRQWRFQAASWQRWSVLAACMACALCVLAYRVWNMTRQSTSVTTSPTPVFNWDHHWAQLMIVIRKQRRAKKQGWRGYWSRCMGWNPLHDTPWCFMLGATDAGKSDILLASDFDWKSLAQQTQGGNLYQWAVADEAVCINIEHAALCSEQHANESWHALLRQLRKRRPRRPLDGVLICLPAEMLQQGSTPELSARTRVLRSRLTELQNLLGNDVPFIYVVTDANNVEGLDDFYKHASPQQRVAVSGFLCTPDETVTSSHAYENAKRHWLHQLRTYAFHYMNNEQDDDRRRRLWLFSDRVKTLLRTVDVCLNSLGSATTNSSEINCRGLLLSTHTHVPHHLPTHGETTHASPHYDPLRRVIATYFPAESKRWQQSKQQKWQIAGIGISLMLSVLAVLYVHDFRANEKALDTVEDSLADARSWPALTIEQSESQLTPLKQRANTILTSTQTSSTTSFLPGLNQAAQARMLGKSAYIRFLQRTLWPWIVLQTEARLLDANITEDTRYTALMAYMMAAGQVPYDAQLLKRWASELLSHQERAWGDELDELFGFPSSTSFLQDALTPPINTALINTARQRLTTGLSPAVQLSRAITREICAEHPAFSIQTFPRIDTSLFTQHSVERRLAGIWTTACSNEWDAQSARIEQLIEIDRLMREHNTSFEAKTVLKQARRAYISEYEQQWRRFLANIHLASYATTDINATQLRDLALRMTLTGQTNPVIRLMQEAAQQLKPVRPGEEAPLLRELAEQLETALKEEELKRLLQRAAEFNVALNNALENKTLDLHLLGAPAAALSTEARRFPAPLGTLYEELAAAGQYQATNQSVAHATQALASLYAECNATMRGRFPFYDTSQEAGLDDFARFFAADGKLTQFFQQNFASVVDTTRSPWRFNKAPGRGMAKNENTLGLSQFEQAQHIRDAFFARGQLAVHMTWTPVTASADIEKASLHIGKRTLTYYPGSAEFSIATDWPLLEDDPEVKIELKPRAQSPVSLRFSGHWALIRALQAANKKVHTNGFAATFYLPSNKTITFLVEASPTLLPALSQLSAFRCQRGGN